MDLRALLDSTLPGLGYELVDLELGRGGLIRIFIDSASGITVDDCVKVSNHLTRQFMVEEVDYDRLEVSSPGLDRPLTKEADFIRFAGEMVKLKLRVPMERRKKFVGVLKEFKDGVIRLEVDGLPVDIEWSNVEKARLEPQF